MNWPLPIELGASTTEHQRAIYWQATQGPLGILGGGPGCGKTFVVGELVAALSKTVGLDQIAIGAPTCKAAVRVTETLAGHNITLRARTWHSLLRGGTEGGFDHNEKNPLPFSVLIGDESSMLDCDLTAAIFRARAAGTLVLLVGDVHQHPPVGHGAPLRDLIAAGLPYGELTEIKRNSGGIVEACHAIRNARPWTCGDNLSLIDVGEPEEQIRWMLRTIAGQEGDRIQDVQVLAAVNAKSPLSRKALNQILQGELNPKGEKADGNPFRIGDKIVNGKNGKFKAVEWEDSDETQADDQGQVYVANGELARVLAVESSMTIARLENPVRVVRIPRGNGNGNGENSQVEASESENEDATGTGCSWDLAYALSTHKAQGSEFPTVIVMLDEYPGAKMVCDRSWIYTSISRAKNKCYLIGRKSVADAMCRKNKIAKRKTFLTELIHLKRAKAELVEL